MEKNYSVEIANQIKRYLDEEGGTYRFDQEEGVFRFGSRICGKMNNVRYVVRVEEDEYCVYAIAPISADTDDTSQMKEIAEYICRANYGMRNGNFEFDFNDGEIRYKCYVNCEGILPTQEIIGASICCPATMFSVYGEGILQVLFNDASAAAAVERCESLARQVSAQALPSDASVSYAQEAAQLVERLRRLQEESEDGEAAEG